MNCTPFCVCQRGEVTGLRMRWLMFLFNNTVRNRPISHHLATQNEIRRRHCQDKEITENRIKIATTIHIDAVTAPQRAINQLYIPVFRMTQFEVKLFLFSAVRWHSSRLRFVVETHERSRRTTSLYQTKHTISVPVGKLTKNFPHYKETFNTTTHSSTSFGSD